MFLLPSDSFAGKKVVLASLNWPPYTGEQLVQQGATAKIVRAAFGAVGYEVEIRFLPWNRAMEAARLDKEVDGYFPEYPNTSRKLEFNCSESIGKSPIGVAKRKDRNLSWRNYADLEQFLIGVVDGYVNSEKFDSMVTAGLIGTDTSVSDVLNLRKVLAGRVDMGIVDVNTYSYLLRHDEMLRDGVDELELDKRLLAVNDLIVCFSHGKRGQELRALFNQGLKDVHRQEIQRDYFESLEIVKKP